MCMLFGFSANKEYELSNTIKKFFQYSYKNPHGWGIAFYNSTYVSPQIIKEAKPAYRSEVAKELISNGILSRLAIAHIRYATFGRVEYNNTHPFVMSINNREWVFAHNGSIEMSSLVTSKYTPFGNTDSEKLFCTIADQLSIIKTKHIEDEIRCIESAVHDLSAKGKLNLIITDGKYLIVHSNLKNSLYRYKSDGMVCFATKVMQQDKWENIELNTLLVYKDGEKIYQGATHNNEYFQVAS